MSSAQAKSFHSITIGDKNTWDDWHLVPTSRPLVAPPPPNTSYADIVGGDGSMDLTVSLTSKPVYGNRSGSWEFIVVYSGQIETANPYIASWATLFSDIMAYVHGKYFERIILDDEPDWYYSGRLSVSGWSSQKDNSRITITYNVDPYKRKTTDSTTKKF